MNGRKPTKDEKAWMVKAANFGCIACFNNGIESPACIHHIDGSKKKGCHFLTLPLCFEHHLGKYGTGFHSGRVKWEKTFGTQWDLLKQLQTILQ